MAFLTYIFGPKLYMEYGIGAEKMYEPTGLEKIGDQILSTLTVMFNVGYYTSPFIATYLYRRGYLATDSISLFTKFATSISVILVVSLFMRGYGRLQSHSYTKMIKALELSKLQKTEEAKRLLRLFDIDFRAWEVDFDINNVQSNDTKMHNLQKVSRNMRFATLPCQIAAYIAMHTFGIRMIYPGSVKLLQSYMRPMLVSGRAKLIEKDNATRYKLRTVDNNEIDTIFVDNRTSGVKGKTLVICSEGNAGFYEIGIMGTPLSLKYSVLGWNHPGFEGSTGSPYPEQEKNAIDAVVKFAINKLGFAVNDIILYGWSIGAYTTLWAALCYPDVKGVILDATFDDILYLAQPRMPAGLSGVVKMAIREHCNLNNLELMPYYNGPISFIRRTEDEIIAEDNFIETNRINYLVIALLKYRYPNIYKRSQLERITTILSKPLEDYSSKDTNDKLCMSRLTTYASDKGVTFPMLIGADYSEVARNEMAEFLLRKHLRDYTSTHCTPLPEEFFTIPFDIPIEKGFVFT